MAVSVILKLTCVVLACVVASAPHAEASITCGTVVSALSPCIPYLRAGGMVPPNCCAGVKSLNGAASTTPDRQTACGCMKKAAAGISGLNLSLVQSLPGKCGVSLPYKFAPSTDCTKVT